MFTKFLKEILLKNFFSVELKSSRNSLSLSLDLLSIFTLSKLNLFLLKLYTKSNSSLFIFFGEFFLFEMIYKNYQYYLH